MSYLVDYVVRLALLFCLTKRENDMNDRRTTYQTRRLVDLTVVMLEIGVFTNVRQAAEHLRTFNVPVEVAVRTLARWPS